MEGDALDIHASISALSFFNVSNRHTFGAIFKLDTRSPAYVAHRRDNVIEMIVRFMAGDSTSRVCNSAQQTGITELLQ